MTSVFKIGLSVKKEIEMERPALVLLLAEKEEYYLIDEG